MTRLCLLAYDTYNKYIKRFSHLYLKLVFEENKKGSYEFFFGKKLEGEDFFQIKKGITTVFRKIRGTKTFFD